MLLGLVKYIQWRALLIAATVGASVFVILNLILIPIFIGVRGTLVLHYMASLVLGTDVLVNPPPYVAVVGLLVHLVLAILFSTIIVFVVHRWGLRVGLVGGAILGLALYSINTYMLADIFPWFLAIDNPVFAFSHIVFGFVVGGVYEMLDDYDEGLIPSGEVAS